MLGGRPAGGRVRTPCRPVLAGHAPGTPARPRRCSAELMAMGQVIDCPEIVRRDIEVTGNVLHRIQDIAISQFHLRHFIADRIGVGVIVRDILHGEKINRKNV